MAGGHEEADLDQEPARPAEMLHTDLEQRIENGHHEEKAGDAAREQLEHPLRRHARQSRGETLGMGLPVGQSAESLGEVGKFALGYARAAPVGMLPAGLFDKAVLP